MSSSTLTVNFAFADATTKVFSMGSFANNSVAVMQFKSRLQMFNEVETELQKNIQICRQF